MADLVFNLNQEGYIIKEEEINSGVKIAVYYLRYKGIIALEEYNRYLRNYYPSLIISIIAVIISFIGLMD